MRAYERARAIKTRFVSKKRFNLDFCKSTIAATLAEAEAEAEAAAATAAALVEVTAAEVAAEAEVATAAFTALNEIPNGQCKFAYFKSDN